MLRTKWYPWSLKLSLWSNGEESPQKDRRSSLMVGRWIMAQEKGLLRKNSDRSAESFKRTYKRAHTLFFCCMHTKHAFRSIILDTSKQHQGNSQALLQRTNPAQASFQSGEYLSNPSFITSLSDHKRPSLSSAPSPRYRRRSTRFWQGYL